MQFIEICHEKEVFMAPSSRGLHPAFDDRKNRPHPLHRRKGDATATHEVPRRVNL
jgi:hypothetical protein